MIATPPLDEDSPDPVRVTPRRVADQLHRIGEDLARLQLRVRALAPFLDREPIELLHDQVRAAALRAVDLGSAVRVGQVPIAGHLDADAGRGKRPIIDRIEDVGRAASARPATTPAADPPGKRPAPPARRQEADQGVNRRRPAKPEKAAEKSPAWSDAEADAEVDAELQRALAPTKAAWAIWMELREAGATDVQVRYAIQDGWAGEGVRYIPGKPGHSRRGRPPAFWLGVRKTKEQPPLLQGGALVARARRVMEIPLPAAEVAR